MIYPLNPHNIGPSHSGFDLLAIPAVTGLNFIFRAQGFDDIPKKRLKGEGGEPFYCVYINIYIDIYILIDYISHRETIREFKIGFLHSKIKERLPCSLP